MNGRAFVAIIRRSLDRRFAAMWLLGFCGAFAFAFAVASRWPGSVTHTSWLITLLIIGAMNSPFDGHRNLRRRVSLFAMPLYGRELARALSVEPCLASLATPFAVALALAAAHHEFPLDTAVTILVAVFAATLVRLSADVRTGANAALYTALALVAEAAIVTPLAFRTEHPLALTLPLAGLVAFFALRAFGETLARYDPLPA